MLRHGDGPKIISWPDMGRENARIRIDAIGVIDPFVIDVQLFVTNLNHICGKADNTLDKILVRGQWGI